MTDKIKKSEAALVKAYWKHVDLIEQSDLEIATNHSEAYVLASLVKSQDPSQGLAWRQEAQQALVTEVGSLL